MSSDREPETALEQALTALEGLAARRETPGRWDVRDLLLALGARIRIEGQDAVLEACSRAHAAAEALGEAWEVAVGEELALACAEHVQSVDPRYLTLPNYDFRYTTEARGRLEDRLRAAALLGLEAPAHLMERVREADRLLAAHLAERGPEGDDAESP